MKKTILPIFIFLAVFIAYTYIVTACPLITSWDKNVIVQIQSLLLGVPDIIPKLPDCILYVLMIVIPLVGLGLIFIRQRKWLDTASIAIVPLGAYILNYCIKHLIQRPRPPYELQLGVHPDSFSYVSTHSLVTFCIWAMVIYFAYKNEWRFKTVLAYLSALWILFVGFSRVWLGVHNPTDVIGAYLLGFIIVFAVVNLKERV